MKPVRAAVGCGVVFFLLHLCAAPALSSNCEITSVGTIPVNDLGSGMYLNQFQGGLYPGGLNTPPPGHHATGLGRAASIAPLDTAGNPDPAGSYVLVSIGMSNTTQEFCSGNSQEPCTAWSFMGQAAAHTGVNDTTLEIVNGARGGQASANWTNPAHQNYQLVQDKLTAKGLSEAQVQVLWIKQARPGPVSSLPAADASAYILEQDLGDIARAAKVRYPNLQIAFYSSRIYAGYASTALNPEPFAYEGAFAVKWLIEAQINQVNGGGVDPVAGDLDHTTVAPWLAWGPYLWADGLLARSDGLTWECADLAGDGTHPSMSGQQKVGTLLLDFFLTSPYAAPWFTAPCAPGDPDGSGNLDGADIKTFVDVVLGIDTDPGHVAGSDMNCDGQVTLADVAPLTTALVN